MNKFFTLAVGVILVLIGKGIVWGQMTNKTIAQPPLIPAVTTSSGLPKSLNLSRFDALAKKSPFTLASATADAKFAKDLVLGGYFRTDGEDFVIVADKTTHVRWLVGRKPSSAQGMVLQDLLKDPSGDLSKLQARIRKGTEMAVLALDKSNVGDAPAAPISSTAVTQPPFPNLSEQQSGRVQGNFQGKAMGIPSNIISRPVITPPLPK